MKMTNTKKLLSFFLCIVLIAAMALLTTACNDPNKGDGKETSFDITSSKKTVGEALLDENLIEGDNGAYGLYVKKVNGILAEYETTGTYWAFYINGEYGLTGVDKTDITDGATYTFKVEKA